MSVVRIRWATNSISCFAAGFSSRMRVAGVKLREAIEAKMCGPVSD